MKDSLIFRGKVPDDKRKLKLWLNGNLLKFLTISCLAYNQCLVKSLIYYFF